jgi:hypothetical protein
MKLDTLNLLFSNKYTEKVFEDLMGLLVGWKAIYDSSTKKKRESTDIESFYKNLKIMIDCLEREMNDLEEMVRMRDLEQIFDTLDDKLLQNHNHGMFPELPRDLLVYGMKGQLDELRKKHLIGGLYN